MEEGEERRSGVRDQQRTEGPAGELAETIGRWVWDRRRVGRARAVVRVSLEGEDCEGPRERRRVVVVERKGDERPYAACGGQGGKAERMEVDEGALPGLAEVEQWRLGL